MNPIIVKFELCAFEVCLTTLKSVYEIIEDKICTAGQYVNIAPIIVNGNQFQEHNKTW